MSTYSVPVVRLGSIEPHPNADTLGITRVGEYPVIVKLGQWHEGDIAAYVPVDSIAPVTPEFAFLTPPGATPRPERIKAKRLRGIFSMGLLASAPPGMAIGDDAAAALGLVKWEPSEALSTNGDDEAPPHGVVLPVYDLENWRAHSHLLADGETVSVTEKIHGCNARFLWHENRLWCASRTRFKRESDASVWWRAARASGLADKLRGSDGFAVYGEAYGQVQDLKYGAGKNDVLFRAFDVWDAREGVFLGVDAAREWCAERLIDFVPEIYRGAYSREAMLAAASGPTVVGAGVHFREGVVIKPLIERRDDHLGRVALKLVSEEYLLRKGGTEER